MEGSNSSEVQRERKLSSTEVTQDVETGNVGIQSSRSTIRKVFVLVSLFLVCFVVFVAFSVPTPFFPNEVSHLVLCYQSRGSCY